MTIKERESIPMPMGTGNERIANHWLQATAKAAPEPHSSAQIVCALVGRKKLTKVCVREFKDRHEA